MRIAIDLTATPKSKTGIGRYMLGLLKGLQAEDRENEYYLFAQDDDLDGFGIYADNFHMVPVKSRILRRQYIRILWEQIVFPWRLRKLKIDVLHCPNYTMPYTSRLVYRHLAVQGTFHDMTYYNLPECHVGWKREMFKWYIKRTARSCDKILTISENSRIDIPKYCRPRNPEIAVTYMGIKEDFLNSSPATGEQLAKYRIDSDYILYVGTLEPRKNVPGLIAGYRALPDDVRARYKLVIVGKKGWMYDEIFDSVNGDPALRNNVIFTGFVDDEDMLPLMHSASAFAYISLYEGFGIPVIEGMASGVPTVTSYGSSLEEVAGGCCFLCEPKSADSVAEALSSALDIAQKAKSGDPAAREFIKAARDRASFFTWNACARETVKSYEMAREKRK